jgi:hypothetical protein
MRNLLICVLSALFLSFHAKAQENIQLKSGDLIFQNLDCGPLCDAINAVTQGYQGNKFSHMGMVLLRNDSILVIEASGKNVHLTLLQTFLSKSYLRHWHFQWHRWVCCMMISTYMIMENIIVLN